MCGILMSHFFMLLTSTHTMERELITYPIWKRYTVLSSVVTNLPIRDRRKIFQNIRKYPISSDMFFPNHGFTLSEFAVWHILGDTRRKNVRCEKNVSQL